jgi:CRP/FNR family cyclic AMP-dependent transcriptional regulator
MNTPYGLEIIESCLTCKLRKDKWFCCFSPPVLKSFSSASHLSTYPGGAVLFVEGQMPRGALVLCSGKVKLSTTSREGKVLILKMAEAGEVTRPERCHLRNLLRIDRRNCGAVPGEFY